ncbi:MAG: RNase adapter RapZ, partial [Synergistaceae bacterium]|nr:RNase adapter RapZ [Synergistaceae bacterium]
IFESGVGENPITIIISSFGFKNGIPLDCDYLFDVRFLPNPNYVPELRRFSGADVQIREFMDRIPEKGRFVDRAESLLEFVLNQYGSAGKRQMHAAVGCTGGRHRSVAVAEELASRLALRGYSVSTCHRDIDREAL